MTSVVALQAFMERLGLWGDGAVVHCVIIIVAMQAFMERLGLWGDGAVFSSFEQFLDTVQKKGLGELSRN